MLVLDPAHRAGSAVDVVEVTQEETRSLRDEASGWLTVPSTCGFQVPSGLESLSRSPGDIAEGHERTQAENHPIDSVTRAQVGSLHSGVVSRFVSWSRPVCGSTLAALSGSIPSRCGRATHAKSRASAWEPGTHVSLLG